MQVYVNHMVKVIGLILLLCLKSSRAFSVRQHRHDVLYNRAAYADTRRQLYTVRELCLAWKPHGDYR